MTAEIHYRWISGPECSDEEWAEIDDILAKRGWMSLSREYTRLFLAEKDGETAFCVFQGMPYCGPLYVPPKLRGTGIAAALANGMVDWLLETDARGWLAIAESPHAEKFCKARGMVRVNYPVYMMPFAGGIDVESYAGRTETEEQRSDAGI